MDDLLSENEQLENIRKSWQEYRFWIIGGLVLGAGLIFGYNHIKSSRLQAQLDGSTAYEQLLGEISDGDLDAAEALAADIQSSYDGTTYAGQSSLAMARLYMDKGRDQDAADALQFVLDSDTHEGMKHIARLRLARTYLYQEKPQDVVDLLGSESGSAFDPNYKDLLGDAHAAMGEFADAAGYYQEILADPDAANSVDVQLVQWKSLDLPVDAVENADASPTEDEPEAPATVESDDVVAEENE